MAAGGGAADGGSRLGALQMRPARALLSRRAGVLLHPTSLDGPDAIGDIGPAAVRFVRWLAATGFSAWQMLPIGPVGEGDSPYSARSSFAGEPMLISLDSMVGEGWLDRARLAKARRSAPRTGGWSAARRFKGRLFREAYESFLASGGARRADYRRFIAAPWMAAWCGVCESRGEPAGYAAFLQFAFDRQWDALRAVARAHGVLLVGDLPIFVSAESADVAEHPELFRLDRRGRPTVVTGVPPDCFSRDGQRWAHPHYRWSAHRRDGFRWWRARVREALHRFDLLRVDHFVGFAHAYEIPAAHRTARRGRWRPTPGRELLRALAREFGPLPFIAEDLGAVTPAVTRLRDDFALPGMRIVQHGFGSARSPDVPHRHPEYCVAYPGTHDNDTLAGWWRRLDAATRRRVLDYAGGSGRDALRSMLRITCTSRARIAVFPMQDLLGLGSEARMNTPGSARGQWSWRLRPGWSKRIDGAAWRRLIEVSDRGANEP